MSRVVEYKTATLRAGAPTFEEFLTDEEPLDGYYVRGTLVKTNAQVRRLLGMTVEGAQTTLS